MSATRRMILKKYPEVLMPKEVENILGISDATLRRYDSVGFTKPVYLNKVASPGVKNRTRRYLRQDIEALLQN